MPCSNFNLASPSPSPSHTQFLRKPLHLPSNMSYIQPLLTICTDRSHCHFSLASLQSPTTHLPASALACVQTILNAAARVTLSKPSQMSALLCSTPWQSLTPLTLASKTYGTCPPCLFFPVLPLPTPLCSRGWHACYSRNTPGTPLP